MKKLRNFFSAKVDRFEHPPGSPERCAEEWISQGDRLFDAPGTTHKEGGRTYRCTDAYVEALKHNPKHAAAWGKLAYCTRYSDVVVVNGIAHTKRECAEEALTLNPKNADGWYSLGSFTGGSSTVKFQDTDYTTKECFLKGVACNPDHAGLWRGLGYVALEDGGSIVVSGVRHSGVDAYQKSVLLAPQSFTAWCNMGVVLPRGATTTINGEAYGEKECYFQALKCRRHTFEVWTIAELWTNISIKAVDSATGTVTIDKKELTKLDCAIESVKHDPLYADAWDGLAFNLKGDATVTLFGRTYTKLQCCQEALKQDPSLRAAWARLDFVLQTGDSVEVNGVSYTKKECNELGTRNLPHQN